MGLLALSLLYILTISTASGGGSDEAALLDFKARFCRRSSSSRLVSWNSSTNFCIWEGVTCSRRRRPTRVVALNLPSSNLTGTLSPAIDPPTALTVCLSYNSLSGEFPANLTSCISLKILDLDYNQLGGYIPVELGNKLTQLQMLLLTNNSITGPIPPSLGNLSSLRNLYLDYNHLEGLIPASLGKFPALQELSLEANMLTGKFPALQELSLEANMLTGEFPQSMWNLSTLRVMGVGLNMLQGSIVANICEKFPLMRFFGLNENRFNGVIPSLSNLSRLTDLYLATNNFTGSVPPTMGRLQSLKYLYIGNN
uniref:Leucine-rich repeat-containing N-terminal plant-type domain-containing protein n=1 Tax=Leersia perrieri TaxID=77586 RepID=A0A0D9VLK9_9ORYZ